MSTSLLLNRITMSALLLCIIPLSAGVAQELPAQQPRRSPFFAEREAQTAQAAEALREATAENWRLIQDPEVGTVLWADFTAGPDAMPGTLKAPTPAEAVERFLAAHGSLWGLAAPAPSLRELSEKVDPQGGVHFVYQQVYRGVDVEGAELAIFVNRDGQGSYVVETVSGRFHPDIDIDVLPALDAADAVRVLTQHVSAQEPLENVTSRLMVLLVEDAYRLAWRVEFYAGNGAWGGHVDATDGGILNVFSLLDDLAPSERASKRGSRTPTAGESATQAGSYEDCEGVNVFGNTVFFRCFNTGSGWELRDNSNPSSAEIRVYDHSIDLDFGPICIQPFNLSSDADDANWDDRASQDDDASAMWNGHNVLDHYRTKYGRDMFTGSPANQLRVIASRSSFFNAVYCGGDFRTLTFFEEGTDFAFPHWISVEMTWLATAGSREIFGHEFQHGVNDTEGASDNNADFTADAIDEALADYFGVAWTGSVCSADDIILIPDPLPVGDASPDSTAVHPGCSRTIEPDVHAVSSGFAAHAIEAGHEHEYGLIVSSALWDGRKLTSGWGSVYDNSVMDAVRFWIRPTPTLLEAREAVVKAIKQREHNNEFGAGARPSYWTENEFHDHEVGPVAVLAELTEDGLWEARIQGEPGTVFRSKMFAGFGQNNDGSITEVTDQADNEPQDTIGLDGTLTFFPGQQGWNGARFHTGDDGHDHSVRIRISTTSGCCGDLFYYDAWEGTDFPQVASRASGGGSTSAAPDRFELRQAVGEASLVQARLLNEQAEGGFGASIVPAGGVAACRGIRLKGSRRSWFRCPM